jgi:copper chaperone
LGFSEEVYVQETFQVPDISCGHCKKAIEDALHPLDGVESAEVSVPERSVTVEWQPETVARERLLAAIEEAGYSVGEGAEPMAIRMKGSMP